MNEELKAYIIWVGGSIAAGLVICYLIGCASPIVPKTNVPHHASYDQNALNSGVLAIAPSGGRIVTYHFRDRYNALIDLYGDQFIPNLKHDVGMKCDNDNCEVDKEHYIDAAIMIQFKRDGRIPTSSWKKILQKISTPIANHGI